MRVETFVYRIPLLERFTILGEEKTFAREKVMEVDGIGLTVLYHRKEDLTHDNIRRHLIGQKNTVAFVSAGDPGTAIRRFHKEWKGARVGTKSKALRINPEEPVIEYPPCDKLHRTKRSRSHQFICGAEDVEEGNGNGEFGICVLEGYDPPGFFCPMEEYEKRCFDLAEHGHDFETWENTRVLRFHAMWRSVVEQEAK